MTSAMLLQTTNSRVVKLRRIRYEIAIAKAIADKRLNIDQLKASVQRVQKIRSEIKLAKNELSVSARLAIIGNSAHLEFVQQFQ